MEYVKIPCKINHALLLDMHVIQMINILTRGWAMSINIQGADLMQTKAIFRLQLSYLYACLSMIGPCPLRSFFNR